MAKVLIRMLVYVSEVYSYRYVVSLSLLLQCFSIILRDTDVMFFSRLIPFGPFMMRFPSAEAQIKRNKTHEGRFKRFSYKVIAKLTAK